jgi:hypothetical protein
VRARPRPGSKPARPDAFLRGTTDLDISDLENGGEQPEGEGGEEEQPPGA